LQRHPGVYEAETLIRVNGRPLYTKFQKPWD